MKFPKIKRHHVHHGGLILGGLAAAIVFFAVGAVLRLLIGPVSLAPFSSQLRDSIAQSLPGITVQFDQAALEWTRSEGRVNVVILGAKVFDSQNRLVAQAPKAAVDLAAGPFFSGKIAVQRITLIGVQLTMVRCTDGVLRLGVEGGHQTSDVLQRLIDDISKTSGTGSLRSFAVRDARIAFFGEASGLFVVSPQASLSVTKSGRARNSSLQTNVDALIEISGHTSHFVATLDLPQTTGSAAGHFSLTGFNLRGLGLNAPAFAALKNADLSIDTSGNLTLEHGTRLKRADLDVSGSGTISDPRFPGGPMHVRALRARVRYDGDADKVMLDDASIDSDHGTAHMTGQGTVEVDANGLLTRVEGDVNADQMRLNIPGFFAGPISFKRVMLRAGYVPSTGVIDFERVWIDGDPFTVDVSGKIVFASTATPSIDIQGKIGAIGVRDLLRYWPLDMAAGARAWIDENMPAGRLGPIILVTHIPQGGLGGTQLPESDVNMSFAVEGASAIYVNGLTPLTDGNGSALLTGDTFKLDITSAHAGPLAVTNAHVIIPNLHAAELGEISAHVEGSVPDTLKLIDMKPLGYPSRFGIDPAQTKGTAAIDLDFHVPMIKNESVDALGISVKAALNGLAVPLGAHMQISDGAVNMDVGNSSLHATGTASLSGARMTIDWTENFKPAGPFSTALNVKGLLDEKARASLGMDLGDYLSGPVGVTANLQGAHGKLVQGTVALDLTPAAVAVNLIDYSKAAGVPASAQFTAHFAPDGAFRADNLRVTGSGLLVTGSAGFDKDGGLTLLDLPALHAGPANDFTVKYSRTPAAGLNAAVTGRSFDGEKLMDLQNKKPGNAPQSPPSSDPFHISIQLNTLALRNGVSLSPFALTLSGVGDRPDALSLNATLPKGQPVTASIASGPDGRKLAIDTPDAGTLVKGLLDFTSMKGGTLSASATLGANVATDPPGDPKADFQGTIDIKDFRITNQPFLLRLFSAGSLDGIANLLQEHGIVFDKMVVPFSSKSGVIAIKDARAAGSSLGITADGYIDRTRDQVSVGGTLAPVYGINSLLGALPLLGNVLVSKQGEGIIGMTYSVSGNSSEPDVSVNPLSVLTPGIFRRIFEGTHVPPPPLQQSDKNGSPPATPAPQ